MTNKKSLPGRLLAVLLSIALVLPMLATGFVLPDTALRAAAVTVNSYAALNSAIATANSAGSGTQTTIQLSGNITGGGVAALTAITGNVLLDLNGYSITFSYTGSDSGTSNSSYQLPTNNAGGNVQRDTLPNAIFTVNAGGTMKIVNSGTDAQIYAFTDFELTGTVGSRTTTTSTNLINCSGTLILGDKTDAGKNNFTLYAGSTARMTSKGNPWNCYSYATALTVSLLSESARFYMYGGTVNAAATGRSNYNGTMNVRCFPLNIEACYSAEIYGGSINVLSDNECGVRSTSGTDANSSDNWFVAIRCNDDNVFIFDVNSSVSAYVGSDTSDVTVWASNIWAVEAADAPVVYGGRFVNSSSVSGSQSGTLNNHGIRGSYRIAASGSPTYTYGADLGAPAVFFTLFYMGDTDTTNSHWYGSYATFRDFIAAYSGDPYYAITAGHINDTADYPAESSLLYTRTGYAHTGWRAVLPGMDAVVSLPVSDANTFGSTGGTVFLLPTWTPITYYLTYNPNGGTYNSSTNPTQVSYTIESTDVLPTPTRNGYTFAGWRVTTAGGSWAANSIAAAGTSLTGKYGTVTLTAQWTPTQYTLTYDTNGGTAIAGRSFTIEDTFTLPVADKTGYTFQSWLVTACAGGGANVNATSYSNTFPTGVWGNVTLKAIYTANTYALSYNLNYTGAPSIAGKTVTYDAAYETLPAPSRTGYGFNGWFTAASGGTAVNAESIYRTAGDSTIYAQWTANAYTVFLYYNYGEMGQFDAKSVTFDAPYGALNTPSRPGYSFTGWYTAAEGGLLVTADTIYQNTGNGALYARWQKDTYTLTFNANGGSAAGNVNYTIEDTIILPTSTRNGYSLRWVCDTAAGSWLAAGKYAPGSFSNVYGSTSFTAEWTPVSYTVSLALDGGSVVGGTAVSYTIENAVAINTPVKAGYAFEGWLVTASSGSIPQGSVQTNIPAGNYGGAVFTAQWETIDYTITYDMSGGSYNGSGDDYTQVYTIESTLDIPEPTRTAYTFHQWTVDAAAGNWIANDYIRPDDVLTGKYGDVTLLAQWLPVQYTLSFNSDGGSTFGNRNYTTVSGAALPASVKDGYTLLGWQPDASFGAWDAATVYPAGTAVVGMYGTGAFTAIWQTDTYTATLEPNGGTVPQPSVSYDILHETALPSAVRAGYEFSGWRVDGTIGSWTDGQSVSSIASGNFGNVAFEAQWNILTYDATFYSQNTLQTALTITDYTVEDTLTLPSLSRENYTFAGWKPVASVGSWNKDTVYAAGSYPASYGTVQFDAVWNIYTYTVEWRNADSSLIERDMNVPFGTIPSYDSPTPEHAPDAQYTYVFSEWSPTVSICSGANGSTIVYTAVFDTTVNTYTVTWRYESDESGTLTTATDTVPYGEMPVFAGIPAKVSSAPASYLWQFTGWTPSLSTVTGDITYDAVFAQNFDPVSVTWHIDSVTYTDYGASGQSPAFYTTPIKANSNGYSYTFEGWSVANDGTTDYYAGAALPVLQTGVNVDYYAIFVATLLPSTVTLRAAGGTVTPDTVTFTTLDSFTLPLPVRTGYTFTGWQSDAVGNWDVTHLYPAQTTLTGMYGNATLTAQWVPTAYTVTVYPNDGSANYTVAYDITSAATLPEIVREGYTFTGWYVLLGEGDWTQGSMLDYAAPLGGHYGNLTVQAQWQVNRYTLTWVVEGTSSTETYDYGATVLQRTVPPKTGYSAAWNIGTLPATMPAQSLTITAVYTLLDYTIAYNADGGNLPAGSITDYTIISEDALPIPTKAGSLFAGWIVTTAGGNWVLGTTTAVNATLAGRYGNVALKAIWTPTIHTITWMVDGVARQAHWYYGAMPSYDGTPVKAADAQYTYTFSGWTPTIERITGDATYTALFDTADRYYTVTWMKDGTMMQEQTYRYGETPSYSGATPTRAPDEFYAYTFSGWTPAIEPVAGPQTYFADFTVFTFVRGLNLDYSSLRLLPGETWALAATVLPVDADSRGVTWYSEDGAVASVDQNGMVTATGIGSTRICVYSVENPTIIAYCAVSVTPIYTTWLEVRVSGSTSLPVGSTVQLSALTQPLDATFPGVNWVTMDAGIALVNENGLVTIVGVGTTRVYAYSADGYCAGSVSVEGTQEVIEEPEKVYYVVNFSTSALAGGYIVNGVTMENGYIKYLAGSDVTFSLVNNKGYQVKVNGVGSYFPDENGVYTIRNLSNDITILVFSSGTEDLDDELSNDDDTAGSFFDKLGAFFRRIVLWFRSLFG